MASFTIRKGLDLLLHGEPDQSIREGHPTRRLALLGDDFPGLKPTMAVKEGDRVKLGQLLFTDKKRPGVRHTSPGCGTVSSINRGAKRKFESVVIDLEGDEEETFTSFAMGDLESLPRESVQAPLVASGLWAAFKTRPFGKAPALESVPRSIFVTAMETTPLAPDPAVVLRECREFFLHGLTLLTRLTDGKVHLCIRPGSDIPRGDHPTVVVSEFGGPHPAGLPGTHIHFLDPVSEKRTVWSINYQEVVAIGRLFLTGRLSVERIIALGGPGIRNPRLIRTRLGAAVEDLLQGEVVEGRFRVLSGSVLTGRQATGEHGFLGRFHQQISTLPEGGQREFLNWVMPGFDKFSIKPVFVGALGGHRRPFNFTTSTEGSERAMVPIGMFEKVMPLDILPTFLLRALSVGDDDQVQALGGLELVEEDLALCSFVCPGKGDYGPMLRASLERIEKDG